MEGGKKKTLGWIHARDPKYFEWMASLPTLSPGLGVQDTLDARFILEGETYKNFYKPDYKKKWGPRDNTKTVFEEDPLVA